MGRWVSAGGTRVTDRGQMGAGAYVTDPPGFVASVPASMSQRAAALCPAGRSWAWGLGGSLQRTPGWTSRARD